jgi:hypothetical protein
MAVALLSEPGIIQPVYSIQEFELYDSARSATAGLFYEIVINIAGTTRTIRQLPDQNKKAKIDIQEILQDFFESKVLTHSALTLDNSTGLLSYNVTCKSYVGATVSSVTSATHWIFNGKDLYNRTWNSNNYIFDGDVSANFLSTWTSSKDIHLEDGLFVQLLSGVFSTLTSTFTGIKVTKYNKNGTSASVDITTSLGTDPKIFSLNIGPTALNAASAIAIDANVTHYTVQEKTGLSRIYTVNIIPKDSRYNEYFRIFYVGGYGQTEAYNFDLTPTNTISISRTVYANNRLKRVFGTNVEDSYSLTSDWMNEATSENLKELWGTPYAELYKDSVYIPIIINENSKTILNRKNNKLINYTLAFTYAEEYLVQKQ